jgi:hypothetical protein
MECPKCGYLLDDLDGECPRCGRPRGNGDGTGQTYAAPGPCPNCRAATITAEWICTSCGLNRASEGQIAATAPSAASPSSTQRTLIVSLILVFLCLALYAAFSNHETPTRPPAVARPGGGGAASGAGAPSRPASQQRATRETQAPRPPAYSPPVVRRQTCFMCGGSGYNDCPLCVGGRSACYGCGGTGWEDCIHCAAGCEHCGGQGATRCTFCNGAGQLVCTYCQGKGSQTCTLCNGTGAM